MSLAPRERAEIDDLLARYGFALDLRDWAGLRSVFASDAVIDYAGTRRHTGTEAIVEFFRASAGSVAATQHLMHTSWVWSTGAHTAEGLTHVTAHHIAAGVATPAAAESTYTVTGTYTDRFQRTDDGWRIGYRRLRLLTRAGDPGILTLH
ncbi:nuclear transport factor 2 family protein [Streptosporangium sp. CA-115845]|uniref:nuclear transport factor 2 family protein n=1 Tax=Streptosporangium sp. CA-115845 TaxID=3240071 RepID=UPI003D8B8991